MPHPSPEGRCIFLRKVLQNLLLVGRWSAQRATAASLAEEEENLLKKGFFPYSRGQDRGELARARPEGVLSTLELGEGAGVRSFVTKKEEIRVRPIERELYPHEE